eukprot:323720-Pelagomonas_calceolata.AAC.1
MKQGMPISLQDFTDNLRHRLHGAWRAVEGVDSQTTNIKLPTYQAELFWRFFTRTSFLAASTKCPGCI